MTSTPKQIVDALSSTCAWIERADFGDLDGAMEGVQRTCHEALTEIERLSKGWSGENADFERFIENVILHRDRSPMDFDDGDEAAAIRYVRWLEAQVYDKEGNQ